MTDLNPREKIFHEICASDLGLPSGTFIFNLVHRPLPHSAAFSSDAFELVFTTITSTDEVISLKIAVRREAQSSYHASIDAQRLGIKAHDGITCVTRFMGDGPQFGIHAGSYYVVTAGHDGYIRCWHADNGTMLGEWRTPNGKGVSALVLHKSEDRWLLAAGTEHLDEGLGEVAVYIWDLSFPSSEPMRAYVDSHNDTITTLSFHHFTSPSKPTTPSPLYLVSASTDGLITLTDVSVPSEDDAVALVLNNKAAVNHAVPFVDAAGIRMMCALSADEKMSIYEIGDLQEAKQELEQVQDENEGLQRIEEDLREQLKCDYAVALRHPQHELRTQTVALAVGAYREETLAQRPAHDNKPTIDIYTFTNGFAGADLQKPDLANYLLKIQLVGAHGEEVVRDIWHEKNCPIIVTCGEDSHIRVWAGETSAHDIEMQDLSMGQEEVTIRDSETSKKTSKKGKRKDKDLRKSGETGRFRPY